MLNWLLFGVPLGHNRAGPSFADEWPPQGKVSFQVYAVGAFYNPSGPSVVIMGQQS
ncbi:hypothetical protein OLMES_1616 [Oleiphilus messinensis]|uniref:Uncharacterized protein n=1 Tax=Oleiphilus messinensis TaxID=141451 RepID=A0A1Y0I5K5_9GAMM|nr:hypothetical protein OLMES_1616 [Oleiphilus messinensis]